MKTNDGGPAFPLHPEIGHQQFDDPMAYPGMSLRAWLAGMALQGWVAGSNRTMKESSPSTVAKECLRYADAMLAKLEEADDDTISDRDRVAGKILESTETTTQDVLTVEYVLNALIWNDDTREFARSKVGEIVEFTKREKEVWEAIERERAEGFEQ
jgi:hypothetical protein